MSTTNQPSDPCTDPTCKVAFWTDIVTRGAWEGRARSLADARLTLGSLELVCAVFHRKTSALCTCRHTRMPIVGGGLGDSDGCIVHDPNLLHEAARVRARLIETTRRAGL